jgi:hypothetical protein
VASEVTVEVEPTSYQARQDAYAFASEASEEASEAEEDTQAIGDARNLSKKTKGDDPDADAPILRLKKADRDARLRGFANVSMSIYC